MRTLSLFFASFFIFFQSFGQVNNNSNYVEPQHKNTNAEENKIYEAPSSPTVPASSVEKQRSSKMKAAEVDEIQIATKRSTAESSVQQGAAVLSTTHQSASTQLTSRSPSALQQRELNRALIVLEQNAPQSFEYNYYKYIAGNYDISLFPYLQKAQGMKPKNSDVIAQLAAYAFITENSVMLSENLIKLEKSGKIEQETILYAQDLLESVPRGGILITHGFDDTYASILLNSAKKIRTDVQVISLDFMQSKVYRDSLQHAGFILPSSSLIDVQFLNYFCAQNENKNLYISMTFPKPYLESIADHLIVNGLTFNYTKNPVESVSENEMIWQKFQQNASVFNYQTEKGKQLSSNYLPLLFCLRENYLTQKNKNALKELDKALDQIGMRSNKFTQVNNMRQQK